MRTLAGLVGLGRAATAVLAALAAACSDEDAPPSAGAADAAPVSSLAVEVETPKTGDPARAAPRVERARAAIAAVDYATARRELDLALTADPACIEALDLLGWLLLEPGPDLDEGVALVCFAKLARLGVTSGSARGGAGVAHAVSGDMAGARPLLESALASDDLGTRPERASRVQRALGQVEVAAGRPEQAEASFRKAIELEPVALRQAEPLAQLGDLLAGRDRLDEAEQALRDAVAADPDHVRSHYLLARLLARRGKHEEANREARIHELLRQVYDHVGSREAANPERKLRLRVELAALAPEQTSFVVAAVKAQLEARRYADAERTIRDLATRRPPTAELAFLLARARAGQGDLDGADKARGMMRQLDPGVPAHLDRAIAEEWKRGVPGTSPEAVAQLLARWGRG